MLNVNSSLQLQLYNTYDYLSRGFCKKVLFVLREWSGDPPPPLIRCHIPHRCTPEQDPTGAGEIRQAEPGGEIIAGDHHRRRGRTSAGEQKRIIAGLTVCTNTMACYYAMLTNLQLFKKNCNKSIDI
jgi:hypothetical protein